MIELKNYCDSKVPEKAVIKFWYDLYRLNQNKNVVCGGAAMYVSETTELQPSAHNFAHNQFPIYYESQMCIIRLVEWLIQNLYEKEQALLQQQPMMPYYI